MESSLPPETDAPGDARPGRLLSSPSNCNGNGHSPPEPASVIPPEEPALAVSPSDEHSALPAPLPLNLSPGPDTTAPPLEERLQQLEKLLKDIQETRVTDRPAQEPPTAQLAPPFPVPRIDHVVPADVAAPPLPAQGKPPQANRSWMLAEMLAEARAIRFMFFDPRYRMSWQGRLIPLVLLAAFLTTGFWLPGASIVGVGRILEKGVELILCFALFKVLSHEARRYRETAPDLPPWLK